MPSELEGDKCMKFGCSMEMINMHTSEMGAFLKLSKSYWVEMFKLTSAAGFRGIELPYNPGQSSGLTRSGMPVSRYVTQARYGSAKLLRQLLRDVGIEEVTSVHLSANDVMNELVLSGQDPMKLGSVLEDWAQEAIEFISELGGKGLVVSPTPEIGLLEKFVGKAKKGWEEAFLDQAATTINNIGRLSAKSGVRTCVTNEYWSLTRGDAIDGFLEKLDQGAISYSPDPAHLKIAGVDPLTTIRRHLGKVSYVRFSDTSFEDRDDNYRKIWAEYPTTGAQRVFLNVGEGIVDLPAIYRLLEGAGYDGWVICSSNNTLNVHRALLYMRWYIDHMLMKGSQGGKRE
jgi:sugar phosphate isomerase/epimerase